MLSKKTIHFEWKHIQFNKEAVSINIIFQLNICGGAQLDWYPTVDLFIYALEKSDFFINYTTCIMLLIYHYLKSIYH
jgi:hypothetical protein